MIVGYARTSTTDQKAGLEAQLRDLRAAGCEDIYQEEVSSVDTAKREKLAEVLRFIRIRPATQHLTPIAASNSKGRVRRYG